MDLLFWNVRGIGGNRRRTQRVLALAVNKRPEIIGLTEVGLGALEMIRSAASDTGYTVIHDTPDPLRNSQSVLMVSKTVRTGNGRFEWNPHPDATFDSVMLACELPTREGTSLTTTVAVTYNYSNSPMSPAAGIREFADEHSNSRVIAGGDWNMAHALNDTDLNHLGTPAFTTLEERFGWRDVPPGENGTEIPTYPMEGGLPASPRQIDRVFTRGIPDTAALSTSVEIPPVESPILSDHALLWAHLEL